MSLSTTPTAGPDRTGSHPYETIPVGEGPHSVAASSDGRRVYVTNFLDGTVTAVDTPANTVATTFPVAVGPYGVALDPPGERLYVAEQSSDAVKVFDTATGDGITSTGTGARPYGLAVTVHPEQLLIANAIDGQVMVSDLLTKSHGALTGIDFPVGLAADPGGNRFYASNYFANTVSVYDATEVIDVEGPTPAEPLDVFPVDRGPYGLAVGPHDSMLYVAHFPFDTVSVINIHSGAVTRTVPVPGGPRGVAVGPDGDRLYVTAFFERSLVVIPL
ncbi:SMP-30/gluconolactonase/LRE family protein [Kitasatospora sp. NPDC057500]|uniref:SMP-30/gluconolactonase/LRE family protein n=1 Tax=Kitasatospora sp. NPDC057500 TaxID=3346151 RepID=UPI003688CF96